MNSQSGFTQGRFSRTLDGLQILQADEVETTVINVDGSTINFTQFFNKSTDDSDDILQGVANLFLTPSERTAIAANTAKRHDAVTIGTANGLSLSGQQLSLDLASNNITGALASNDWTTFNNKQAQLIVGPGLSLTDGSNLNITSPNYFEELVFPSYEILRPINATSMILSRSNIVANLNIEAGINLTCGNTLGVGTLSPSYNFDVNLKTTSSGRIYGSSTTGTILRLENSSTNGRAYSLSTNAISQLGELSIYDHTASEERFRVQPNGNVLIANNLCVGAPMTANVVTKAHVKTVSANISSLGAWSASYLTVSTDNPSADMSALGLGYDSTNNTGVIASITPGSAYRHMTVICDDYRFFNSGSQKAVIKSDGKTRIGSSGDPDTNAYLDVNNQVGATVAVFGINDPIYLVADSPNICWNAYYNGGWKRGRGASSAKYGATMEFDVTSGSLGINISTNNPTTAGSALTMSERMRIKSDGTFGFNTNSPSYRYDFNMGTSQVMRLYGSGGNGVGVRFESSSTNGRNIAILNNGVTGLGDFAIYDYTVGTTRFYIAANGFIHLNGTNPGYLLTLANDSAAKPSSSLWTVTSDERIKENIIEANIDRCLEIVKSIPLKRYTWKDEVYGPDIVKDRSKLGWIAQDVQKVFPKAVDTKRFTYNQKYEIGEDGMKRIVSEDVIEDCLDLNADQIYAVMYGAIQKLIQEKEEIGSKLNKLTQWAMSQGFEL